MHISSCRTGLLGAHCIHLQWKYNRILNSKRNNYILLEESQKRRFAIVLPLVNFYFLQLSVRKIL
jgi:hypothetical protein